MNILALMALCFSVFAILFATSTLRESEENLKESLRVRKEIEAVLEKSHESE